MSNITSSAARTTAVGKYLVALSGSYKKDVNVHDTQISREESPSGRRKQLHILYLLNDLLHHTKHHSESSSDHHILTGNIQPYLVDLVGYAAAYSFDVHVAQHRKIQDLLDIWDHSGYYHSSYIGKLRETVANAAKDGYPDTGGGYTGTNSSWGNGLEGAKKDAPYIMPPSHGDPSIPYYDLPAGNILPHIIPDSATPINPQLMKPLQFVTGPADESLVIAVTAFLEDVEALDNADFGERTTDIDIDELGQPVLRDKISGELLEGVGYYGWSTAFCERMKQRGEGADLVTKPLMSGGVLDRSLSPRKRRRYSDSASSRSRSRSSSMDSRDGRRRPDGQRPFSHSRTVSRDGRRYRSLRSHSRSSSYSPPPSLPSAQQAQSSIPFPPPPQTQSHAQQGPSPAQPAAFAYSYSQTVPPLGPGGFPIPPPRPANYLGQWPPPPPPPPPPGMSIPSIPGNSPPLLTGPRTYQNNGPSSYPPIGYPNFQGHMSQGSGGWGPSQQSPNGPGYPGQGRGHPFPNGNVQNIRGGGFARGGWSR